MTYGKYLLLGSNLGDKQRNLLLAKSHLSNILGIKRQSSVYETAAWGKTNQSSFYNQVLEVTTQLSARELLSQILKIEDQMGRIRNEKWGSRIIDIDILYYDDQILNETSLTVPHPVIPQRNFTLTPLCEIAPEFVNPVTKLSNQQMLDQIEDQLEVRLINP